MQYYKFYSFEEYGAKTVKGYKETFKDTVLTDKGIFVSLEELGFFHITSVSREDFVNRGYNADDVSDGQMRDIAEAMSDSYCESGQFWSDIDFWAEELNLPKID